MSRIQWSEKQTVDQWGPPRFRPPHIASAGGAAFWTGWLEAMLGQGQWTEEMLTDLMYTLRIEIIEWILATRQSGPLFNAASKFMRDNA